MKRFDRDPDSFDEDDSPCMCGICSGWFDLDDGESDPKDYGKIICSKCATERQKDIYRQEEIEELLSNISDAEFTIKESRARLKELNYNDHELIASKQTEVWERNTAKLQSMERSASTTI
jgi:hypothetical protein